MSVNIWSNGKLVPIASSGTYVYNMPLGSIIAFSGDNIPVGFLLCDGSTLNKNEYLDLFNVIGYTYGGSDNEFKLPDLRDRFIQGANGNLGKSIEAGLPNIVGRLGAGLADGGDGSQEKVGAFLNSYKSGNADGNRGDTRQQNGVIIFNAALGEIKTDGNFKTNNDHKVYGASDTVQPPAVALYYIIKATDYKDVPYSAFDDSATTTGNVWSAAKVKEEIDNKNNYSTEETVIGKWIDGKPIYRKVLTGLIFGANADKWSEVRDDPQLTINNIDKIINGYGIRDSDNAVIKSISFRYSTSLQYFTPSEGFTDTSTIVIEYTKTTD